VYQAQDNTVGIGQVQVKITDVNKSTGTATTNSVGNFYITASTYTPTYPADVELDYTGLSQAVQMLTHIGREGSCGYCHFDPAGPTTPGHVFLALDPSDLPQSGGTP
jgi:hypothetical protein